MEGGRRAGKRRLAVTVLLAVLVAFHSAPAQKVQTPSLDEILFRLDSNLRDYDAKVPNFFCNEHVTSVVVYGKDHQSTVTDSVFRLERSAGLGHAGTLRESREVKTINGSPAEGKEHRRTVDSQRSVFRRPRYGLASSKSLHELCVRADQAGSFGRTLRRPVRHIARRPTRVKLCSQGGRSGTGFH